ncbi:MAG: hypothetical protein ACOCP8_03415 [archaeon]
MIKNIQLIDNMFNINIPKNAETIQLKFEEEGNGIIIEFINDEGKIIERESTTIWTGDILDEYSDETLEIIQKRIEEKL